MLRELTGPPEFAVSLPELAAFHLQRSMDTPLDKLVPLVPKRVIEALARKKGDPTNPLGKLAAEHHGGGEA